MLRSALASAREDDDDTPNRVVFTLSRDLQKRLDRYLVDRVPFMSRTQLQRLIKDEGGVTVNGRAPKRSTVLRRGDVVEVFLPPPPSTEILPEPIPLAVLYEDDAMVVVNKDPDIIVHPARSHNTGTMLNALVHHFSRGGGSLSGVGKRLARPGVVHRLDRDTTGVIVFAKDDEAHWKLGRQFEKRTVDKRYLAITHGHIEPDVDVISMPIGPHPSRQRGYRERYVVRHDELGKPSTTIYRVRARLGNPDGPREKRFSIVELELKTGRTHQIRVHLTHLGYPIVGDDMYDGAARVTCADVGAAGGARVLVERQALHAASLSFTHPISGERVRFEAPLREDMLGLVEALRASGAWAVFLDPPGSELDMGVLLGEAGA